MIYLPAAAVALIAFSLGVLGVFDKKRAWADAKAGSQKITSSLYRMQYKEEVCYYTIDYAQVSCFYKPEATSHVE